MNETKECTKCRDDLSQESEEELCADCKQEELEANEIDTAYKDLPTCPHCGWQNQDWWDGTSLKGDGDQEEDQCGGCRMPFKVTIHIEATFTSSKIGGDER